MQSFFRQLLPVVKTNEERHPMSCDWNPTKCFAHKLNFHAWKIKTFRDQDCLMVFLKSWKFGNQISSASFSQSSVSQHMHQNFKQFYFYFLAQCPMSSYHMLKKNPVCASGIKAEKQQGAKYETSVKHQILHRNRRAVFTKADKTELRPTYLFRVDLFCFFFFYFCETLYRLSGNPFLIQFRDYFHSF